MNKTLTYQELFKNFELINRSEGDDDEDEVAYQARKRKKYTEMKKRDSKFKEKPTINAGVVIQNSYENMATLPIVKTASESI
jgi:hypothetical protein